MARWRRAHPVSSMPDMVALHDLAPQQRIIALYEAMSDATTAMLAAARAENWDLLVTLEAACAAQVATLQQSERNDENNDENNNERKAALITQMLADDGELRRLITARMTRLSSQMSSASTERKLARAYGG